MNDDLISRQAEIDAVPRTSVEYICRKNTVSTNPYEHKYHDKFIQFMDDPEISDFGRWQHSNGFNTALVAVKCDLDKVPSVTPKQPGWIPCSERLPEDCADVFITYVHDFALTCPPEIKKMFVGTDESGTLWEVPFADYIAFYDQEEKKWFMPSEDPQPFPDEIKVVAWMPLPEPYIEEKRENHEID